MHTTNQQPTNCPACGAKLETPLIRHCAISRYANTYICNDCGTEESFNGFFWRANAIALGLLSVNEQ